MLLLCSNTYDFNEIISRWQHFKNRFSVRSGTSDISILSLSPDGSCLVHSTCGELLHKLSSSRNWTFPHLITLTNRGHIIVHYADQKGCLAAFSCNGKQFAQCALGDPALVREDMLQVL